MTEIDPYEDYHGPSTPKGFCPLCLSPERKGGQRVGMYITFECETSAEPTGWNSVEGTVRYRNAYKISIGDPCFRNVVRMRDQSHD